MVWLALAAAVSQSGLNVSFQPGSGLSVSVSGVPLIQRSGFQYYAKGWTKGYFSSTYGPAKLARNDDGTVTVTWDSPGDHVHALGIMTPRTDGCTVDFSFDWSGPETAYLELTTGQLWATVFGSGQVGDGKSVVSMTPLDTLFDVPRRILGSSRHWTFDAAPARMQVSSDVAEMIVLDGRSAARGWTDDTDTWWLGASGIELRPGKTVTVHLDYKFLRKPEAFTLPPPKTERASPGDTVKEFDPKADPLPVLPTPKSVQTGVGFVECSSVWMVDGPNLAKVGFEDAAKAWARLWEWSRPTDGATSVVEARSGDTSLPPEGYVLEIRDQKPAIRVRSRDELGLRNAFRTLGMLARPVNGRLRLPVGVIKDWPTLGWRGVHMFVGPEALAYQSTLIRDVLGPLKFNHVVLQCERTNWDATPGIATDETMKKADLVALFERYRRAGIEPIPLVQSFGHCEWLFANNRNRDICLDPNQPYAVDPDKPRTQELLASLWIEVVQALHPRAVHFGLDEVDMLGADKDPAHTTARWKKQLTFLMGLAKKLQVTPMLWGDMALAPGEAPDATNAPSVAVAKERRSVLSSGTMVADWHYVGNPDPAAYTSLKLWKQAGMVPVASPWYDLDNVRGQALAAKSIDAGLLTTTWAGYTSNQGNTLRNFDQFAAYVAASDYAWSGREDKPGNLGYDPAAVLRRLMLSPARPLQATNARSLVPEGVKHLRLISVGPYQLEVFDGKGLQSPISEESSKWPSGRTWTVGRAAKALIVGVDCFARVAEGREVGRIQVRLRSGKTVARNLVYGQDVRAEHDEKPTGLTPRNEGVSAVFIPLADDDWVTDISLVRVDPVAGLRLDALAAIP